MAHAELFDPTKEELSLLKKHESFVSFEILPPIGISEGRQSRVSILEYRTGSESRRVIWKRMGAGKGLNIEEANTFERRLLPYRQNLIDFGWNIPELYFTQVIPIGSEYQIFSYEELIPGGDAELMVLNPIEPQFRKWFLLRRVVETLSRYPTRATKRVSYLGRDVTLLPHGLDLKLANLVLRDRDNNLFFVDLFGPKELMPDGLWQTYSPKLDTLSETNLRAITATREGALLRLYRLIEKHWAGTIGSPHSIIRDGFLNLVGQSDLPTVEKRFIRAEVTSNYPWLDLIYSESQV